MSKSFGAHLLIGQGEKRRDSRVYVPSEGKYGGREVRNTGH